jgi:hypothetical protein
LIVLVRMQVQVEERVYGYKTAAAGVEAKELGNHTAVAAGERARLIDHIHHVEQRVRQPEQSSATATEEREKRIYRTLVLVGRGMLIDHMTAVAVVERRIVVVVGIRRAQHIQAVVVGAAADMMGVSGKRVVVEVAGIAGTG